MRLALDRPLAMSDGEHTPTTHSAVRQECPHAPQFPGSLVVSVHAPLHATNAPHPSTAASTGGAGVVHVVPMHTSWSLHTAPAQHASPAAPHGSSASAPGGAASGVAPGGDEVLHADAHALARPSAKATPAWLALLAMARPSATTVPARGAPRNLERGAGGMKLTPGAAHRDGSPERCQGL
jgi:hypothetical protein